MKYVYRELKQSNSVRCSHTGPTTLWFGILGTFQLVRYLAGPTAYGSSYARIRLLRQDVEYGVRKLLGLTVHAYTEEQESRQNSFQQNFKRVTGCDFKIRNVHFMRHLTACRIFDRQGVVS